MKNKIFFLGFIGIITITMFMNISLFNSSFSEEKADSFITEVMANISEPTWGYKSVIGSHLKGQYNTITNTVEMVIVFGNCCVDSIQINGCDFNGQDAVCNTIFIK